MLLRLVLLIGLIAATSSGASAKSNRIVLWGVQRGCTPNPDLVREVEKKLTLLTSELVTLSPDSKRLGCQGQACAAQLLRDCPGMSAQGGMLLGAAVESGKGVHKIRMWLHDMQAGVTAYKDEYCQGCSLLGSLPDMLARFAENPSFTGAAPGLTPMFCQPSAASPAASRTPIGKIHVLLPGELRHKSAVWSAVKQQIQSAAIEAVQAHSDSASPSLGELTKMTAKEPSQVLVIEARSGGKFEVSLFDGPTQRTEAREVDCQHCDKDEQISQLRGAVGSLLAHCFGDQCASSTASERVPPEACQPFQILRCGGEEQDAMPINQSPPPSGAGQAGPASVSPSVSRLTKGVLWGLFAAGAVTTGGLLAANYTGAGTVGNGPYEARNVLIPAAGAAAGLSVLILAGAIPVTIILDRQRSPARSVASSDEPTASRRSSPSLPPMRCPN